VVIQGGIGIINATIWRIIMKHAIPLLLIGATLGAAGMTFAPVHEKHEDGESVKALSSRDIKDWTAKRQR
jgi:hypothetical protein